MVNACLGVFRHTLLEEVGLALKRNHIHKVEGIGGIVDLLIAKSDEQTIGDELDVLTHELGVHADEGDGESISQELLLDDDRLLDDFLQELGVGAPPEVTEQEASKVGVHTLITADQFVGEGETSHEPTLLQPEDRSERSRKEDTFNSSEGNKTFAEGCTVIVNVAKSPVGLLLDAGNSIDGTEEIVAASGVLDVHVDKERVRL